MPCGFPDASPARRECLSISCTRQPRCARLCAADVPASPPPTTIAARGATAPGTRPYRADQLAPEHFALRPESHALLDSESCLRQATPDGTGAGVGGEGRAGLGVIRDRSQHARLPHLGVSGGRESVQEPGVHGCVQLRQRLACIADDESQHDAPGVEQEAVPARRERAILRQQRGALTRQRRPQRQRRVEIGRRQRLQFRAHEMQARAGHGGALEQPPRAKEVEAGAKAGLADAEHASSGSAAKRSASRLPARKTWPVSSIPDAREKYTSPKRRETGCPSCQSSSGASEARRLRHNAVEAATSRVDARGIIQERAGAMRSPWHGASRLFPVLPTDWRGGRRTAHTVSLGRSSRTECASCVAQGSAPHRTRTTAPRLLVGSLDSRRASRYRGCRTRKSSLAAAERHSRAAARRAVGGSPTQGRRGYENGPARAASSGPGGDYFRCLATIAVISNIDTCFLPAKTGLSLSSALIMRLFTRVLELVLLDVVPDLLGDLGARHRLVADHRCKLRAGRHGLHESRIRLALDRGFLLRGGLLRSRLLGRGFLLGGRLLGGRLLGRGLLRGFLRCGFLGRLLGCCHRHVSVR